MSVFFRRAPILACLLAWSCSSQDQSELLVSEIPEAEVAAGEPVSTTTTVGPVKATVTLTPKEPLIGDMMELVLEVEAQEGVSVEMPNFQEAFSRFAIEGYGDEAELVGGVLSFSQSYRLQANSSGRLRVPPLRVVFVDERPDKDDDAASEGERELLTDEISIKVAGVPEGEAAAADLKPVRRTLEEDLGPSFLARYWWAFAAGLTGVLVLALLWMIRRGKRVAQVSPYERASVALAELEAKGLPEGEELDNWYVQLSGIVRRYLEDRFGLRAPELTTEEFLRVAQRSVLLSAEHKGLLVGFLADCDKVKFAGYEPGAEESREVLEAARRFILETRPDLAESEPSAEEGSSLSEAEEQVRDHEEEMSA